MIAAPLANPLIVPCEACGTEGKLYHEQADWVEACPYCEGTGGEIIESEPITLVDAEFLSGGGGVASEDAVDAERWAKTRFIASLIPDEVDLSQPHRVALALLDKRCRVQDFADVFDDAMAVALVNRLGAREGE